MRTGQFNDSAVELDAGTDIKTDGGGVQIRQRQRHFVRTFFMFVIAALETFLTRCQNHRHGKQQKHSSKLLHLRDFIKT